LGSANINHTNITYFVHLVCEKYLIFYSIFISGSWETHAITPPTLFQTNSEIILHGPHKEVHGSTSEGTTIINSDKEIKLVYIDLYIYIYLLRLKCVDFFFLAYRK